MNHMGPAFRSIAEEYVPLQLRYGDNPRTGEIDGWRVLALCIMLNRASRNQVEPVARRFFNSFSHALYAEAATYSPSVHELMEDILRPLGFHHTRTLRIGYLSKEYLDHEDWRIANRVTLFSGCGRYAQDAWRVFVERDYSRPAHDIVVESWRLHMLHQ